MEELNARCTINLAMGYAIRETDSVSVRTQALVLIALVSIQMVIIFTTGAIIRLVLSAERVSDRLTVFTRTDVFLARVIDLVESGLARIAFFFVMV